MKYEVLVDNYGFRETYWAKGTIVEIDPEENPPQFFKPLEEKKEDYSTPSIPSRKKK